MPFSAAVYTKQPSFQSGLPPSAALTKLTPPLGTSGLSPTAMSTNSLLYHGASGFPPNTVYTQHPTLGLPSPCTATHTQPSFQGWHQICYILVPLGHLCSVTLVCL